MSGAMPNSSYFSALLTSFSQASVPVVASSAIRWPSDVERISLPVLSPAPRLLYGLTITPRTVTCASLALGFQSWRQRTTQVAASSATVTLPVGPRSWDRPLYDFRG